MRKSCSTVESHPVPVTVSNDNDAAAFLFQKSAGGLKTGKITEQGFLALRIQLQGAGGDIACRSMTLLHLDNSGISFIGVISPCATGIVPGNGTLNRLVKFAMNTYC